MKKALILLLAVLYITVTSGVMVNVHYCMGEVAGVKYGSEKTDKCGTCGSDSKQGCCHVDYKFIKSGDQQVSSLISITQPSFIDAGHATIPSYNLPVYTGTNPHGLLFESPPDGRLNALRFYNCVYRI